MSESEQHKQFQQAIDAIEAYIAVVKGDTDTPGFGKRISDMEVELRGGGKDLGLAMKVKVMWIAGAWVLGLAGTVLGFVLHPYMVKLANLLK